MTTCSIKLPASPPSPAISRPSPLLPLSSLLLLSQSFPVFLSSALSSSCSSYLFSLLVRTPPYFFRYCRCSRCRGSCFGCPPLVHRALFPFFSSSPLTFISRALSRTSTLPETRSWARRKSTFSLRSFSPSNCFISGPSTPFSESTSLRFSPRPISTL